MQQIIDSILSQKDKSLPKIPRAPTPKDVKLLQQAIQQNSTRKMQTMQLKILLAEAYKKIGSDKCSKQIAQIGVQGIKGSTFQTEARLRICTLINDTFDSVKMGMLNFHLLELARNPDMMMPENKYKIQIINAGVEGLKKNYYKAAVAYYKTTKDVSLQNKQEEIIQIVERAIILCFLSEKSKQLHQLVCQLYIHDAAKKSQLYPLLTRLYSQTIIDQKQAQFLQKMLPAKFSDKDSDSISILNKCIFMHNMISIKKCFETISIQNLCKFTGINEDDLLKMIENSYSSNQLQIDQVAGYVYIKNDTLRNQVLIKGMFDDMEALIQSSQGKK